MMRKTNQYRYGFTLLEVAIALVVIALLIGGGVSLMTASSDVAKYKTTQTQLTELREGLVSYYTQFYRLPCPDTDNDGIENPPTFTGTCTSNRGFLPYVSLGIGGNGDAWGERFKYVVSPKFVLPVATPPTACYSTTMREATGKVSIVDLITPLTSSNPVMDFAAFVVLSTGKNGRQTNSAMSSAFSNDGGCTALNERERENCNNDSVLRSGNPMSDGDSIVFDDMVTWIGDMQLITLLRQTGACDVASESSSFDPSAKTDTDFTTGATTVNEDFNGNDTIPTTNGDDKVVVNGDVKKPLELKDGNNTLLVYGDLKSDGLIKGGSGNDIIRIKGDVYNSIYLYSGDDQLEVEGNVDLNEKKEQIDMGSGNDQVRLYSSVKDTKIELGSGTNTIYIKGSIDDVTINATGGTGIFYYDSDKAPRSNDLTLGSTVTIKCKINNTWTDCP